MEAFYVELALGSLGLMLGVLGLAYVKWEVRRFERRWGKD